MKKIASKRRRVCDGNLVKDIDRITVSGPSPPNGTNLECGGKRSAIPLWSALTCQRFGTWRLVAADHLGQWQPCPKLTCADKSAQLKAATGRRTP
jgi:hypothetical protein